MKGGTRRPYPAMKARNTGRRLARLWPDEDAYDDRVTNQVGIVAKEDSIFRRNEVNPSMYVDILNE